MRGKSREALMTPETEDAATVEMDETRAPQKGASFKRGGSFMFNLAKLYVHM
jgi:hypothetical protein